MISVSTTHDDGPSRKIFPELLEKQILAQRKDFGSPLFRKTSCGVTYAHNLGYQVNDIMRPHHIGRHGRADIGWANSQEATR